MSYANEGQLINQMRAYGIAAQLPLRVGTHKPHRFAPSKGKAKDAWYWLRDFRLDNGSVVLTGAFGLWGVTDGGVKVDISIILDKLTVEKREAAIAAIKARQAADEQQWIESRAREVERASVSAVAEWAAAQFKIETPYTKRKQIFIASAKVDAQARLIVPMIDFTSRALVGVQRISADGSKRFTAGCAKEGAGVRLGDVHDMRGLIGLCEGYATAASIRMGTDFNVPVFAAFDAGNLMALALKVRALYPQARLMFFADDDYKTHVNGQPMNVGRVKAKKAMWAVGGAMKKRAGMIYPIFSNRNNGEKWTDFNDLHVVEGLDELRRQLASVVL